MPFSFSSLFRFHSKHYTLMKVTCGPITTWLGARQPRVHSRWNCWRLQLERDVSSQQPGGKEDDAGNGENGVLYFHGNGISPGHIKRIRLSNALNVFSLNSNVSCDTHITACRQSHRKSQDSSNFFVRSALGLQLSARQSATSLRACPRSLRNATRASQPPF